MNLPYRDFLPERGLRYAVAIDDEPAQIVNLVADMSDATWAETVRSDVRLGITKHKVARAGAHKLRIYSLDPAVTLQKLVLDTGGLQPSYLGPPPSKRY